MEKDKRYQYFVKKNIFYEVLLVTCEYESDSFLMSVRGDFFSKKINHS